MKVLWITNTIFPELALAIGKKPPVVGGWMYGLAKDIAKNSNIKLFVATAKDVTEDKELEINDIIYFLLKGKKNVNLYDKSLEDKWLAIVNRIKPDLVHIHGTEYAHGLSLMKVLPNLNYAVSIQGLISIYKRYYMAALEPNEIRKSITFRDILKKNTLRQQEKEFYQRGENIEKKYLINTSNIIGRTQWDFAHSKIINPNVNYHFCNESLRNIFYESPKWIPKEKNLPPTIFLSQASKPLKGLHQVLKAVHLLKDQFPEIHVRVAGANIVKSKTIKEKLRITSYGKYIKQLITKYNLVDQVTFTGSLNENKMIQEYLNSAMFICPSSIENSPNSVGEAQLLGVPVIASYVGGVSDMVSHEETGILYRFEEIEMLAIAIKRILEDREFSIKISQAGQRAAKIRHSRNTNLKQLISIYKTIITSKQNSDE